MILSTHQRPSQGDAAPPGGLSTRQIESAVECCNVTADAVGGIGARLALRKAEKMDRNGGDPAHEISTAELVARGSAQPPDRSN
jgi:hypothetical protein